MSQESQASSGNKQPSEIKCRCRKWFGTWNNYSSQEYQNLCNWAIAECKYYIIGKEIGTKNETPHLQIWFEFNHQKKYTTMREIFPGCYWRKGRGKLKDNFQYCRKDEEFFTNVKVNDVLTIEDFKLNLKKKLLLEYTNIKWKPWQESVLKYLNTNMTAEREILWYWESVGNVGKSFLSKFIVLTFTGVIMADGKKDNIFHQIKLMMDNKEEPKIIILDIPKTCKDFVNYGVIEQIKNGLIYSGKYEGGLCYFEIPKCIIFANFPPELNKWSKDRYKVVEL